MKFVEAKIREDSAYFRIGSGRIFNVKIFGCWFSGYFLWNFLEFADFPDEIFSDIESSFRRNYT